MKRPKDTLIDLRRMIIRICHSKQLLNFVKGIWFFPSILTVLLIILSILQINGSSMGMYHNMLYGDSQSDKALLFGKPQSIRSDEWVVNTQKIISQKNNGFSTVNNNVGNGENETLINDVPTTNWSVIFKPQNLGFLVLPFNNAFSLRWWIMSYLLVLSCYFFVLMMIPRKKLLASLLSLAMLFSPFIQWWYTNGTLGSIYYSLFGAVVFTKLLNLKKRSSACLWSILLAYIAVCFVLILYPPFQIPCALVLIAFAVGYFLNKRKRIDIKILKRNLLYFCGAIILAISTVGLFVYQNYDVIKTVQNTAYPGRRVITSGGFNLEYLLSSNLSPILQSVTRTNAYLNGTTNQSEASNFILLIPFLLLPLIFLAYKKYRKDKKIDFILITSLILLGIMLAWLFIPGLDVLGIITLLRNVPLSRLLIGLGLLNFIIIIEFIKLYTQSEIRFSLKTSIIYALLVFIFYLLLDFHVMLLYPTFIGYKLAVVLAIPIALIVFCIMRKHFKLAALGLLMFALASTFRINPIYKGTAILTETPLSQAIQTIDKTSDKKWVTDSLMTENFAAMNGKKSISSVYSYPQFEIWNNTFKTTNQKNIYNRYAHVSFSFDRDKQASLEPTLSLISGDQFKVSVEPCDNFLKNDNIGFIITTKEFSDGVAPCASLIQSIKYPQLTFYIYGLTF